MRPLRSFAIFIIVITFLTALYFYPIMPNHMASHWNFQGRVDGYTSKFFGVFMIPILSLISYLLFMILPKLDPMSKNIDGFQRYFDGFMLQFTVFMYYIFGLVVFYNMGYHFNMGQMLSPAFASLFFYIGILIEKAKMNWTIGVRTPWTLSSEHVWNKTHVLAGKLFKLSGIAGLFGLFFPEGALIFVLFPVIFASLFIIGYSYYLFNEEKKDRERKERIHSKHHKN